MLTAAIYHRPESEYAFLYKQDKMRIRLRTARSDARHVAIIMGDPYLIGQEKWYLERTDMTKTLTTDLHDYWEIETGAPFARLQYGFYVEGMDGQQVFFNDQGVFPYDESFLASAKFYFKMPYFQEIDRFKAPEWVKETVWYQIFPERFANGDTTNDPKGTLPWGSKDPDREDFFGGDLQGVYDHLDHLEALGINGIYFCPIFKATSNHKYDTIDYYEIDPAFGDKALFKKLVDEAHRRGMRIMLDAVFNHIGDDSPQWQDVIEKGADSPYADWFHIHSFPVSYEMTNIPETARDLTFDTFAFTPHMPKLNTANPEVQKYLLDIATYWIREFGIDAWRLDVANEIDHHFWKLFHEKVLAEKEDFYILGEIWHSSQRWLQGDEFHAVMNYAFTDNIKEFFVEKSILPSKMISGMNEQQMLYVDQVNEVTFNLLDSHDTARILTVCDGNKELVKAVMSFMFLQKGAPCVYYGTEVSMTGGEDPDCRKCMVWDPQDQDQKMLAFMKALIGLRKAHTDLFAYGSMEWQVDDQQQVIWLKRTYQGQILQAVFNEGTQDLQLTHKTAQLSQQVRSADEKDFIGQHGFRIVIE
ncbi:neopullulanase [Enterococcus canis]|uniref:Neopullulanase n=1 Tax=Enterococcus canis TaxID=214095 RepID=A0A1L8RKD3_9ENTE|nr:glycoside hydrolase family 13 protein [Enterococcus canis]OJG20198.1 neopullulanase [Enterococcus canis]